jgi:uncharacterized protein (DUF302 family)
MNRPARRGYGLHCGLQFRSRRWFAVLFLPLALAAASASAADDIARVQVRGSFDEVKDNLANAITGRGLVINNTAHINDMLERTGRDLGNPRRIYGQAEVLEFCSASVSRHMMEADPHQIAFCPYTIAIYTLPEVAGTVFISYRHPPGGRPGVAEVELLLDGIIHEASQ